MSGRKKQPSGRAMEEALAIMRERRRPVSENSDEYAAYDAGKKAGREEERADVLAWLEERTAVYPWIRLAIRVGEHVGVATSPVRPYAKGGKR